MCLFVLSFVSLVVRLVTLVLPALALPCEVSLMAYMY